MFSEAINNNELNSIAKHIAREIFKTGDEHGKPTTRIQFMSGAWPIETAQGGLCEPALENVVRTAIIEILAEHHKDTAHAR